jgi:hypothetical protein
MRNSVKRYRTPTTIKGQSDHSWLVYSTPRPPLIQQTQAEGLQHLPRILTTTHTCSRFHAARHMCSFTTTSRARRARGKRWRSSKETGNNKFTHAAQMGCGRCTRILASQFTSQANKLPCSDLPVSGTILRIGGRNATFTVCLASMSTHGQLLVPKRIRMKLRYNTIHSLILFG